MFIFYNKNTKSWQSEEYCSHRLSETDLNNIKDRKIRNKKFLKIRREPTVGIPAKCAYVKLEYIKLILNVNSGTPNRVYVYYGNDGFTSRAIIPFKDIYNISALKNFEEDVTFAKDYVDTCCEVILDDNSCSAERERFIADLSDDAKLAYYLNN